MSNQLLIAEKYIESNEFDKVEYIFNRLIQEFINLQNNQDSSKITFDVKNLIEQSRLELKKKIVDF